MSDNVIPVLQGKIAALEAAIYNMQQQVQSMAQAIVQVQGPDFLSPVYDEVSRIGATVENVASSMSGIYTRLAALEGVQEEEVPDAVHE